MIINVVDGGELFWLSERSNEKVIGLCFDGSLVELTDTYEDFIYDDVYDEDDNLVDQECESVWFTTVNGSAIEEIVGFCRYSKLQDSNKRIAYLFEVDQEEYLQADEETRKRAISLNA